MNQLLTITYNARRETKIFKLKLNGISGELLNVLIIDDIKQRVILNDQGSLSTSINVGVPKGTILGFLHFLIFINDIPEGLSPNEVTCRRHFTFLLLQMYKKSVTDVCIYIYIYIYIYLLQSCCYNNV